MGRECLFPVSSGRHGAAALNSCPKRKPPLSSGGEGLCSRVVEEMEGGGEREGKGRVGGTILLLLGR